MTELGHLSPLPAAASLPAAFPARSGRGRAAGLVIVWGIVLANAGVIVWLWVHGGNLTRQDDGRAADGRRPDHRPADIADRDVYVCGPPPMTEIAGRHVRAAGVPRRHIHTERFAL